MQESEHDHHGKKNRHLKSLDEVFSFVQNGIQNGAAKAKALLSSSKEKSEEVVEQVMPEVNSIAEKIEQSSLFENTLNSSDEDLQIKNTIEELNNWITQNPSPMFEA